jgi:hypothetical protein
MLSVPIVSLIVVPAAPRGPSGSQNAESPPPTWERALASGWNGPSAGSRRDVRAVGKEGAFYWM